LQLLPKSAACRFLVKSKIWTWLKSGGVVVGSFRRELSTCVSVAKELIVAPKRTVLRGVRVFSIGTTDGLSFIVVHRHCSCRCRILEVFILIPESTELGIVGTRVAVIGAHWYSCAYLSCCKSCKSTPELAGKQCIFKAAVGAISVWN